MQKQWIMKGARALFAIIVSVDDNMLEYLMEVENSKEVWDIYASMFAAKKSKPIEDNKPKHTENKVHGDNGRRVVEGNSVAEDSSQGEVNERGGAIKMSHLLREKEERKDEHAKNTNSLYYCVLLYCELQSPI
ncbi:hypothetical protein AAC387_Pa09g1815 [Persea americana]